MYSPAFERQKWNKKHDYLVEQFDPVNVRDILGHIPAHNANHYLSWSPPSHPDLTVVPRKCGCMVRWFFECPSCRRRCEDLYPAYLGDTKNLKCRICSGLIYASQRFSKRHPLRKTLTPRKRLTEQRRLARYEKVSARNRKNVDGILQDIRSKEYPDYDYDAIRKALETAIGGIKNMEFVKEPDPPIRPYPGYSQAESEALFEKVKATMMDLAKNAKSKKVREQARKELRDRGLISEEPKPEPEELKPETLSPDSIQLTAEQIEYLKRLALEAGEDLGDFKSNR